MPSIEPAHSRQLIGIQYLRAIAALMVAYFHALAQIPLYTDLLDRYFFGGIHLSNGVDLFFVISGFIMVLTSSRAAPGDFAVRRIIRIVPLYWTLTGVLIALAWWRPELLRTTVLSSEYVIKSLLFVPYSNPGQHGQLFPLLVPGWSLNLEMFFYAIFILVLFLPASRRLSVAAAIFTGAVLLAPLIESIPHGREISFFGDYKLFEFLFGMILANWYGKGLPRLPAPAAWLLAAAGFVVLFWGLPFLHLPQRTLSQVLLENGLPAALIVFAVVSLEPGLRRHPWPLLAYLGDASYSMYLSHLFFLGAARFVWARAGMEHGAWTDALGFALFAIASTIVGAAITYRFVEQPLLRMSQSAYHRTRRSAAPATATS